MHEKLPRRIAADKSLAAILRVFRHEGAAPVEPRPFGAAWKSGAGC
ncbi:MAG: hypothetical protein ABIK82_04440 [Pseudomonadota bacterium]